MSKMRKMLNEKGDETREQGAARIITVWKCELAWLPHVSVLWPPAYYTFSHFDSSLATVLYSKEVSTFYINDFVVVYFGYSCYKG